MPKRNIVIITGTRAEFGIWTPILHALQKSKKLRPQLLVTGMHLQKQFGYTINAIKKSGIPIAATAQMYKPHDTSADSLSRGTQNIARALQKLQPDLVMLLGDRLEMLAASSAALALQLPIAHLHGGETAPGQWDEQIRHALTKLAHLHFPATNRAAQRIHQMGEDPKSIHVIGAPALDGIITWLNNRRPTTARGKRPIVLLHPTSPDERVEERRACMLINAVQNLAGIPFVVIGPNNDPGSKGILRAYEKLGINVAMSLSAQDFWKELKYAGVLVGNSSSGIIEAASFGIPVINLGDRQAGRERNPNVLDLPWPSTPAPISAAIYHALTNKHFQTQIAKRQNLYGDGRAAQRLLKILESQKFPIPTTKRFYD